MDNEIKKLLKDNLLKIPSKDFTARTMQKIHEMQEGQPIKRKISRWFILSPLAASALLALLVTFFLPWGSPGTISWADVQKQLEQVHSMISTSYCELTTPSLTWKWSYWKTYLKDPGLRRIEIYDSEDDLNTPRSEPQWISISKIEPGQSMGMTLHPDAHWVEIWSGVSHTYGPEPSAQFLRISPRENLKHALEQWDQMRKITADKTKRIGSQVINGRPAVGFSFEVPARKLRLGDWAPEKIPGKIWVGRDDGVPMLIELEYETGQGDNKVRYVTSDIQWNVPIEESLFDLTAPAGWGISRHLENSIEYTAISLSPSVTLKIGPEGQPSLVTAEDVAGIVKTERTTNPDDDLGCTGVITIELTPAAAKRLRDYADAHPDKPIVVNFNGQIKVAAKLDAAHPTQLSFDISQIGLSMFKLEEKYTTAAIKKNKS